MGLSGSSPTPADLGPDVRAITANGSAQLIVALDSAGLPPRNWAGFEIYNNHATLSVWIGGSDVTADGTKGREIKAGGSWSVGSSDPCRFYARTAGSDVLITITGAVQ